MSRSRNVPAYNINVPNGGLQQPVIITPDTPIYSSYTGEYICNGPLAHGVQCDAPVGNARYGMNFHVVEYNPANNTYMAHNRLYGRR
jgi:hypothetical protein